MKAHGPLIPATASATTLVVAVLMWLSFAETTAVLLLILSGLLAAVAVSACMVRSLADNDSQ